MGYTAQLMDGDDFVINEPQKVMEQLHRLEVESNYRWHVSWCRSMESYWVASEGDYAKACADMLNDFGFHAVARHYVVTIEGWQGDKVGSTWDEVWTSFVGNTETGTTWIMRGEDDAFWASVLTENDWQECAVEVSYKIVEKEK